MTDRKLKEGYIKTYIQILIEEEKSETTIQKYICDIRKFYYFIKKEGDVTRENVIAYKRHLLSHYKPASVNSMLVALNRFFKHLGWSDLMLQLLKIQKRVFMSESEELKYNEYERLLKAARLKKNERLVILMQAICSTGIRVSEHVNITMESVRNGYMTINNKGKVRDVFFPKELVKSLVRYCRKRHITSGPVFITKTGKPLDRSNIWRMMKSLCEDADVDKNKVYPHNLRHLFAVTYYSLEKDIIHLADILGHSNVETTRIYVRTNGVECQRVFNMMGLAKSYI